MVKPGPRLLTIALCAFASACGSSATTPSRTGYDGAWSGTTTQGRTIAFTVSPDQKVTTITVGYNLNGCSGSQTFSGLALDIVTVQRPPGSPSAGPFENPSFGYGSASGSSDNPNLIEISGAFTSSETATGVVVFNNYSGCGNGGATWNATRR